MTRVDQTEQLTFAGRYRRVRRLGTGGMARVFLAEDTVLDRRVAVKQLPSGAPQEALNRFRREARLGASLNHPNIVSFFDSLSDEDSVLIVMEYVEGESLSQRLKRGPVGREEALSILHQVADALDHAQAHGVVHRDVKPSNILIGSDGVVKLADLGIATAVDATSITGTGAIVGTLAYIAPERLRGNPGEASADVYSLAAVAFELLSGKRAHPEQTPAELLRGLDSGRVPDLRDVMPDADPAAAELLASAMGSDPGERPGSAGALVGGLEQALAGGGRHPGLPPRTQRGSFVPPEITPRRNRVPLAALLAGAVAAGILIGVLLMSGLGGTERRAPTLAGGAALSRHPGEKTKSSADQPPAESQPGPAPAPQPAARAPQPEATPPAAASGAELNSQGYALIQQGRYDEAIPILQRAVDSFPPGTSDINYAYALFNLGNALRLAGRPEEAIPILEQRLQIPNQTATVQHELDLARAAASGGGGGGGGKKEKKAAKD